MKVYWNVAATLDEETGEYRPDPNDPGEWCNELGGNVKEPKHKTEVDRYTYDCVHGKVYCVVYETEEDSDQ